MWMMELFVCFNNSPFKKYCFIKRRTGMRKESIWRKVLAWGISIAIVSVWMPDISLAQENLITEDHVTQKAVVDVTENTTTYQLTDGDAWYHVQLSSGAVNRQPGR